ncbi:hypothetical protein [Thalassotalea agariperforans]
MENIKHNEFVLIYSWNGKKYTQSFSFHPVDLENSFGSRDLSSLEIMNIKANIEGFTYQSLDHLPKIFLITPPQWSKFWLENFSKSDEEIGIGAFQALQKKYKNQHMLDALEAIKQIKSGKETLQNIIDNGEGYLTEIEPLKSFINSKEARKYLYTPPKGGSIAYFREEDYEIYKQVYRFMVDDKLSRAKASKVVAKIYLGKYKTQYHHFEDLAEYIEKTLVPKYDKIKGLSSNEAKIR